MISAYIRVGIMVKAGMSLSTMHVRSVLCDFEKKRCMKDFIFFYVVW